MKRKEILSYTFEEYAAMIKPFHGSEAPGVIIGGYMVDLAYRHLKEDTLYNAICETAKCLPNAIQLLTPCSTGNQWLKIIDVGRYAFTMYDKVNGKGIRVCLDYRKTEPWTEIRDWYLKLKPKRSQDFQLLLSQIREAGTSLFGVREVVVDSALMAKKSKSPIAICPSCDEAYHAADGAVCPACRDGSLPYVTENCMEAPLICVRGR